MIRFKSDSVKKSYHGHTGHHKLKELVAWLCDRQEVLITQGYEKRNYVSVHSMIPFRGVDIRSWIYKNPLDVVKTINDAWCYDEIRPEKKCAMYHDVGRGKHIHLQVHDNTKFIDHQYTRKIR